MHGPGYLSNNLRMVLGPRVRWQWQGALAAGDRNPPVPGKVNRTADEVIILLKTNKAHQAGTDDIARSRKIPQ